MHQALFIRVEWKVKLKSEEDAEYRRSINNEAEIKGNKTEIRNDKQHVSTGQFSCSSSAARMDEWEEIRQRTCTAVQCGGCSFLFLCERVNVCWYLCKHREDLELLSASFTAVGGQNRFKPNSNRRLGGISSLKLQNVFFQICSDPRVNWGASGGGWQSLTECLTVCKITPISYSALARVSAIFLRRSES